MFVNVFFISLPVLDGLVPHGLKIVEGDMNGQVALTATA
jgi:hypothetical protein